MEIIELKDEKNFNELSYGDVFMTLDEENQSNYFMRVCGDRVNSVNLLNGNLVYIPCNRRVQIPKYTFTIE